MAFLLLPARSIPAIASMFGLEAVRRHSSRSASNGTVRNCFSSASANRSSTGSNLPMPTRSHSPSGLAGLMLRNASSKPLISPLHRSPVHHLAYPRGVFRFDTGTQAHATKRIVEKVLRPGLASNEAPFLLVSPFTALARDASNHRLFEMLRPHVGERERWQSVARA